VKFKKAMAKNFNKGICFGTTEKYNIMTWKNHTIETLLRHPQGKDVLKKAIVGIKQRGEEILNDNLPQELLN